MLLFHARVDYSRVVCLPAHIISEPPMKVDGEAAYGLTHLVRRLRVRGEVNDEQALVSLQQLAQE